MNDELQVRDALRSVADAGPDPDVDDAWEELQARLRAESKGSGRRRWVVAGGAALAAAAVVAVVTTRPDTERSIDVDVVDGSESSTPDGGPERSAVGVPITLPADPVAVVGAGFSTVHLMDPTTGERISTLGPFDRRRPVDAVASAGGDVYLLVERYGKPDLVRTRWDGSEDLDLLVVGRYGSSSLMGIAVDPTGARVATGGTWGIASSGIALVDVATGGVRRLSWPVFRQPAQVSFSLDGRQLAFATVGDDGENAYVVDVDAADLSAARRIQPVDGGWDRIYDVAFAPEAVGGGLVAVTSLGNTERQVRFVEGGPDVGLPVLDGVVSVQASVDHLIARTDDAWYALDPAADAWRPIGLEDWTG